MQILQHLNRGYFILHPLKKSHKYYKVINILWKEPLPASSCNAHHLILHCFLPTAPPPPHLMQVATAREKGGAARGQKYTADICCMHLGQGSIERK